jgi:hypothetical protein
MSPPSLAFLAGGRLHLKLGEAPVRSFDSAFGQQVRDRHVQIQQKHSWKEEGRGARFLGNPLWGAPGGDAAGLRVAITSLTRGSRPGELLYALDTEGRTAVCLFRAEDASERRLLHGSAQRIRDLRAAAGRAHIACSVQHPDGTASIAVMGLDATDLREVTEGDVQDRFPAWAPGPGTRLVYQSASLGRDAAGRPSAVGPSAVHLLDLDSGALETLASEPGREFVCPQLDAHGTLYCILMEANQAVADEPPSAVPRSWELVKIPPGGRPETIAEGVVAFDLIEDGSVLYSTGSAIHYVGADGRHQRLPGGERVEALVAFS